MNRICIEKFFLFVMLGVLSDFYMWFNTLVIRGDIFSYYLFIYFFYPSLSSSSLPSVSWTVCYCPTLCECYFLKYVLSLCFHFNNLLTYLQVHWFFFLCYLILLIKLQQNSFSLLPCYWKFLLFLFYGFYFSAEFLHLFMNPLHIFH